MQVVEVSGVSSQVSQKKRDMGTGYQPPTNRYFILPMSLCEMRL